MGLRILIADDHTLVRQAVRAALEREGLEVVGEASDGQEAFAQCRHLQPNVAVLDVLMPHLSGIEATREILRCCASTKVVMLSEHSTGQSLVASLEAGARGYLSRASSAAELAHAIYLVSIGETYISPFAFSILESDQWGTDSSGPLGVREGQALRQISEGKRPQEIADSLNITPSTVRFDRANVIRNLNLQNSADSVCYSIRRGLAKV